MLIIINKYILFALVNYGPMCTLQYFKIYDDININLVYLYDKRKHVHS